MNYQKTARILIIIIISLILALTGVIIGRLSGKSGSGSQTQNEHHQTAQPTFSPEIITSVPVTEAPSETDMPSETDAPEPTETATETPSVTEKPVYMSDLPLSVTEGDLNAVYARLEQLKQLKAAHPEVKIILLDVGHGGFDPGSIGVVGNVKESELNLAIARRVSDALAEKGYYVLMTRMGEYAVGDTKAADMSARTAIMKNDIFTLALSVHMNSFPSDKNVSGTRLYYYYSNGMFSSKGMTLATSILKSICAATAQQYTDGCVVGDDLMVVREPLCPSALIECGFVSNERELALLQQADYQQQIANGVAEGVANYLTNNG